MQALQIDQADEILSSDNNIIPMHAFLFAHYTSGKDYSRVAEVLVVYT